MKHSILSLLCLAVFTAAGQSQKFLLKESTPFELPSYTKAYSWGNPQDGVFYGWMEKENTVAIRRFDAATMKQVAASTLTPENNTRYFVNEELISLGGKHYRISSDWDKKNEKEILYCDEIDFVTNKTIHSGTVLNTCGKVEGTVGGGNAIQSHRIVGKYGFVFDEAKTRMLVRYRLPHTSRRDSKSTETFGLLVFNDRMQKLWGREYKMPYTEALIDNINFAVDTAGNAYLLAKIYNNGKRHEKDKETGKPGYHYAILVFSAESNELKEIPVNTGDFFVQQVALKENQDHRMFFVCTYGNDPESSSTAGAAIVIVDPHSKAAELQAAIFTFPEDKMQQLETVRQRRKTGRKRSAFEVTLKLREARIEKDGSVFLALEDYHEEAFSEIYGSGNRVVTTIYYLEDIIVMKVKPDKTYEWFMEIPKEQMRESFDDWLGYKVFADNSGYYLLYLDNPKNLALANDQEPAVFSKKDQCQLVTCKIDPHGSVSKELVFDYGKDEGYVAPRMLTRFAENQYSTSVYDGVSQKFKLVMLQVKL